MPKVPHFYLWINGEAQEGSDSLEVRNPFDNSLVATASIADRKQIETAVRGAAEAFPTLKAMSRHERAELLHNMREGFEGAHSEIVDALILEGGKPRVFAEQEFSRTLAVFSWAAEEARRFCGEQIPLDGMERGRGYAGYTRREPIGPVLGICPFNFPLNLVSHKVAPALAVGNPILIKPPSNTPISALIMARIASEAGVPHGCLNVLPMRHEDVSLLLEDSRIRLISFTGSPQTGWALKKAAARQPVILELGGNSGTIVDASAEIGWAATRCALGGFAQAGQSCIAVQRIYAHRDVWDPFVDALVREAEGMKSGDPREEDVVVGPVINGDAAERILAWVDEAVRAGARILCGGKRLDLGCGNVILPTVLVDVQESMNVCRREVFGPVVTVAPYRELEEAVTRINDSEYGLQAAIFSNDFKHIRYAIENLETGGVVVNDFPTYRVDHMPYGGVKGSGLGREGIRSAMLEMSQEKMVVIRE